MNKEEFNLSEKIMKGGNYDYDGSSLIFTKNVKEFIKRVLDIFDIEDSQTYSAMELSQMIKKLAGEKLI